MTGTTTQIMLDLADLLGGVSNEEARAARSRLGRMSMAVACFALGCGGAALLFAAAQTWCFAIPPLVALCALVAEPK